MCLDQLLRVGVCCVKHCSNGKTHPTVMKLVEEDQMLSVDVWEKWDVDPVDAEEAIPARTGGEHSDVRGDGDGGRGGVDGSRAEDGDARAACGDAEPDGEDGGDEGSAGGVSQLELIANKHVTITCFFSLTEANSLRNRTSFACRLDEEGFPTDQRAGGDGEGAAIGPDELVARRQREQIHRDALQRRQLGSLRVTRHRVNRVVAKPNHVVAGTVVANHLLRSRGVGGDDGRRSVL